jgi:hypothetical protein
MFDKLQRSLSAPTSMGLFCLLGLAGLAAVVRRRELQPLAGVLIGTFCGFVPALAIAFVTTRYLADLLPLLVVAALIGVQVLLATPSPARRRALIAVVAAGALAGLVVNGSVGLLVQRLIGGTTEEQRASFVRAQDDVDRWLGRSPRGIRAGPVLPAPPTEGNPGDLFVVDRCAALYVLDQDDDWAPVERTARGGLNRLLVRFPRSSDKTEALISLGKGSRRVTVTTRGRAGSLVFGVRVGGRLVDSSRAVAVAAGRPLPVVVSFDNTYRSSFAAVTVDARRVLTTSAPFEIGAKARLGEDRADGALRPFSGVVRREPTPAPVCTTISRRAGLLAESVRGRSRSAG